VLSSFAVNSLADESRQYSVTVTAPALASAAHLKTRRFRDALTAIDACNQLKIVFWRSSPAIIHTPSQSLYRDTTSGLCPLPSTMLIAELLYTEYSQWRREEVQARNGHRSSSSHIVDIYPSLFLFWGFFIIPTQATSNRVNGVCESAINF